MRSANADRFNHDDDADGYDLDVENEADPIRAGYSELMAWIGVGISPRSHVLDLGTGTGNTILALPDSCSVTGVDVSSRMLAIAAAKLRGRDVTLVRDDIVAYVDRVILYGTSVVTSAYSLHHLTPEERGWLFRALHDRTRSDVQVVVGDLMYADQTDRRRIVELYRTSWPAVGEAMEDEFFWDVSTSRRMVESAGWATTWTRFSDLTWGVRMWKTPQPER